MPVKRACYLILGDCPAGGAQFVADVTQYGPNCRALQLPAWAPRKLLIVHAWAHYGFSAYNPDVPGQACEVTAWVDPHGYAYFHADPIGSESVDYTRDISLLHDFVYDMPFERVIDSGEFSAPVLCDRDNGDLLLIEFAPNAYLDWVGFEVHFLVNETPTIPKIGPGY
jgi:hypothetical protein